MSKKIGNSNPGRELPIDRLRRQVEFLRERNYKEVVLIADEAREDVDRKWNPKLF